VGPESGGRRRAELARPGSASWCASSSTATIYTSLGRRLGLGLGDGDPDPADYNGRGPRRSRKGIGRQRRTDRSSVRRRYVAHVGRSTTSGRSPTRAPGGADHRARLLHVTGRSGCGPPPHRPPAPHRTGRAGPTRGRSTAPSGSTCPTTGRNASGPADADAHSPRIAWSGPIGGRSGSARQHELVPEVRGEPRAVPRLRGGPAHSVAGDRPDDRTNCARRVEWPSSWPTFPARNVLNDVVLNQCLSALPAAPTPTAPAVPRSSVTHVLAGGTTWNGSNVVRCRSAIGRRRTTTSTARPVRSPVKTRCLSRSTAPLLRIVA